MAEKHQSALALAAVGHFYTFEVLKFTTVIYGDTFEQFIEQLAETPLQTVDSLDHTGRCIQGEKCSLLDLYKLPNFKVTSLANTTSCLSMTTAL